MDEINRKRLEWMAKAKPGDLFPADLFKGDGPDNYTGWSWAVTEAAQAALDELASYRGIKVETNGGTGEQIVWIDGIKYARSMFEGFAWETPIGECIRIVTRENGLLQIERVRNDPSNEPLNEETSK